MHPVHTVCKRHAHRVQSQNAPCQRVQNAHPCAWQKAQYFWEFWAFRINSNWSYTIDTSKSTVFTSRGSLVRVQYGPSPQKSPISLDYYPKTNKNSLIFMSENLEFQCAISRAATCFLGRKYEYLVLPTVLMPQNLTLFLCNSYKLFCPCYQIPGLYINWLSPSQLIKCNTMGAKKQEKKRLIRIRSEKG